MKINLIHHARGLKNSQTKNIMKQVINDFENNITSMLIVQNKKEAHEKMIELITYFLGKGSKVLFSIDELVIYNLKTLIFIEYQEHMVNNIKEELYNSEIYEYPIRKKEAGYYKRIKNIYINGLEIIGNLNLINKYLKYFCGSLEDKNEYVYFTFGNDNSLKQFYILDDLLKQGNVTIKEIIPQKPNKTYEQYMKISTDYDFFYKVETEGKFIENFNKKMQELNKLRQD